MSHEPKSPSLGMLSTATRTTATVSPLTPSPLNGALVPSGSPASSSALSAQAAPSSSFAAALRKLAKQAEEPRGKRRARPGQPAEGGESAVPPHPRSPGLWAQGCPSVCPRACTPSIHSVRSSSCCCFAAGTRFQTPAWLLSPALCAVCCLSLLQEPPRGPSTDSSGRGGWFAGVIPLLEPLACSGASSQEACVPACS